MSLSPEVHWTHINRRHPEIKLEDVVDAFISPDIVSKEIIKENPENRIAFIKRKKTKNPASYITLIVAYDSATPKVITAYYTNKLPPPQIITAMNNSH